MKGLRKRAAAATRDEALGKAVIKACDHTLGKRAEALSRMDDPSGAALAASDARSRGLGKMSGLVAALTDRLAGRGVTVFVARDHEQARGYVADLASSRKLTTVIKAKSMTGEEAGLAGALEDAGCRVVESDLGEYIVQLRNEPPSHVIAPAIHLSRRQVGDLFESILGMEHTDDPKAMCDFARDRLRGDFLSADLGIVGVNLAVAETGDLVTVTNEGNGRLCETMPKVLVAFTGIEKVVEGLDDAAAVLRVLSKNGTGQIATSYVSLLRGPAGLNEPFGPRELHLVLMDNGRSDLDRDPALRDMLKCIRCGACINCCPVYRSIGGHAYGTTYVGPMGIVLTCGLNGGGREASELPYACTLCGDCGRACPVGIDLPGMILELRSRAGKPAGRSLAMKSGRLAMSGPGRFSLAGRVAGAVERTSPALYAKAARLAGWDRDAPPPVPARRAFRKQWKDWSPPVVQDGRAPLSQEPAAPGEATPQTGSPVGPDVHVPPFERFVANFRDVKGEVAEGTLIDTLQLLIQQLDNAAVLASGSLLEKLSVLDCMVLDALAPGLDVQAAASARVGVTGCLALVAETGSILLDHGPGSERVASLLPDVHVVVAETDQIVETLEDALRLRDARGRPSATLVTGPSRTADIEKTLIIGMHGPRRLILSI